MSVAEKFNRGRCLVVYEGIERGRTQRQAAADAGVSLSTASSWLRNPARFAPHLDEIALQRALSGDLSAFQALSVWEVHEFWDRLHRERLRLLREEWAERGEMLRSSLRISEKCWDRALERAVARESA